MKPITLSTWQQRLSSDIQQTLKRARIQITALPQLPLRLFLLDGSNFQQALDDEERSAALNEPAYWCFCWGSGYAQAKWLFEHPQQVRNKTVLDFGCGSGIGAIAAAWLGAKRSIACDIDPAALRAAEANAALNGLDLEYLDDFFKLDEPVDLILAADVLYDRANHVLVDHFKQKAKQVLIADSRVKNFVWPGIEYFAEADGLTRPDLNELDEFKRVYFYRTQNSAC